MPLSNLPQILVGNSFLFRFHEAAAVPQVLSARNNQETQVMKNTITDLPSAAKTRAAGAGQGDGTSHRLAWT